MNGLEQHSPHWMVRMNHRVRTLVFLAVLVQLCTHLWQQSPGTTFWLLALLQFALYPHLVYLLASHVSQPTRTEMVALRLDAILLGSWIAWLGFPLWIAFPLAIGTIISSAVYLGAPGALQSLAGLLIGTANMALMHGLEFQPQTDLLTSSLGMLALALYLLLVAQSAHKRGQQLRTARENLRRGELALQQQLNENQALQQQLRKQANQDALTGLYNRRYLDATFERELSRCRRESRPLSILALDIDHFKSINDRYGHPAGDEVLRTLARLLKGQARASDVVCRHGGEEFIALLPNMPQQTALERAEFLRRQMQATTTPAAGAQIVATLSIGVATFPENGHNMLDLMSQADAALYRAKQSGRNRICAAGR